MKRLHHPASRVRSAGLSLIELLIAMALSSLLILGLIEIFSSTRGAFASSQALARVQESSRFGLEYLKRDIRMAGQFGCLNEFGHIVTLPGDTRFFNHFIDESVGVDDPAYFEAAAYSVRTDMPLEVYDYAGTAPTDDFEIVAGAPTPAPGANSWVPPIPADLWARMGNAVAGSDVIVARYGEEEPITLQRYLTPGSGEIVISAEDVDRAPQFAPYLLSNCKQSSLFQAYDRSGFVYQTNGGLNEVRGGVYWQNKEVYGVGSIMSRYRFAAYYVGTNASGATSLYRVTLHEAPPSEAEGIDFAPTEEIVEGVEMQQFVLGLVDPPPYTDVAPRRDYVTSYISGAGLTTGFTSQGDLRARLQRIISVRASLLMRSPDVGAGTPPTNPVMLVGDVAVTVPPDLRMRHVYDSTITVRNRVRN